MNNAFKTLLAVFAATTLFAETQSGVHRHGINKSSDQLDKPAIKADQQGKISEAQARLSHLRDYFKHQAGSVEVVFRSLNGQDATNNEGQRLEEEDFKTLISDADNGVSAVKCIANSQFVVTSNPQQLDKSADNWKDSSGQPMLPKFISAIKDKHEEGIATVSYFENVDSGIAGVGPMLKQYAAVIASSKWLLGSKNTSGKKFICYIVVE